MSTTANVVDPVVAAQTTRNLALARRAVTEALANPGASRAEPADASLILIPYDDPELGVLNLGLANKRVAAGEPVRLQRVGVPGSDAPGEEKFRNLDRDAAHLRPRWPVEATSDAVIPGYDPSEDRLLIDFFQGERQADAVLLMNRSILLGVDTQAEDVVGLWVPNFVGWVRENEELMGELLLLTFAPIKGLTRAEAARRRDEIGFGIRPVGSLAPVIDLWDMERFARRIA